MIGVQHLDVPWRGWLIEPLPTRWGCYGRGTEVVVLEEMADRQHVRICLDDGWHPTTRCHAAVVHYGLVRPV